MNLRGPTAAEYFKLPSGSLAKHSENFIDNLTNVGSGSSTQDIYSSGFTQNPLLWCGQVSCVPYQIRGILISPKHVMFAAHVGDPTGQTLNFVSSNGTVYTTTVGSYTDPIVSASVNSDIRIGLLTRGITEITPASFLPSNWSNYFPSKYRMPVVYGNQFKQFCITDLQQDSRLALSMVAEQPWKETRRDFDIARIGGDSGSPVMLLNLDTPVLLTCWSSADGGPFYANYLKEIESGMRSLGTNYSPQSVNLTNFRSFQ